MKTVTISLEDDVYDSASKEAARRRKPLGEFLHDLFLSGMSSGDSIIQKGASATLNALWDLADSRPLTSGTAGPLNRDELYDRGLSGH